MLRTLRNWTVILIAVTLLSPSWVDAQVGVLRAARALLADGTSSAPAFSWANDTDLGRWRIGADEEGHAGSLAIKGPRPWVDVRAYGAKGDGVTDDTATIQAALNAVPTAGANAGGTLFFPAGVYLISSPLNLPSSTGTDLVRQVFLRIVGTGRSSLIKAANNANMGYMMRVGDTTKFLQLLQITDLAFDGNKANTGAQAALDLTATSLSYLTRVYVVNAINESYRASYQATNPAYGGPLPDAIFFDHTVSDSAGRHGFDVEGLQLYFSNCYSLASGQSGFKAGGALATGNDSIFMLDSVVDGWSRSSAAPGIDFIDKGLVELKGVHVYMSGTQVGTPPALRFGATTADRGTIRVIGGRYVMTTLVGGVGVIDINITSGRTLKDFLLAGARIEANVTTGTGVFIYGAGTLTGAKILDNYILGSNPITKTVTTQTDVLIQGNSTPDAAAANAYPQPVATITVTASPFTYTNNDGYPELVTVMGGTVSAISVRGTAITSAATNTTWMLYPGDAIIVTYSVAPAMQKVPL